MAFFSGGRDRIQAFKRRIIRNEATLTRVADNVAEQSKLLVRLVEQGGSGKRGDSLFGLLRGINRQLEITRTIPSTALALRERAVEACVDHITSDERFADMQVCRRNIECLRLGLAAAGSTGTVAEFGVYRGTTLTAIARHYDDRTVHGFDSFVGLPEAWGGTNKGEGAFDIGGTPPDLPVDNVEFHVGFFDSTVAPFSATNQGPFAFVHLDADLYSSTKEVFDHLGGWFVPGTVIVFDEYFGYHGWELHEHRAFSEFLETSGLDFTAVAIGHMNLAVRLVDV